MKETFERIVPDHINGMVDIDQNSLLLHYERYRFAAKYMQSGRVLDMACGVGYGAYLLATEKEAMITEIIAADISEEAIAYARERYQHPKIKFLKQNAFDFSDTRLFNTIISLETIEHLPNPAFFSKKLFDLLLPGGVLIISAPVTPSTDANPYHVNDFSTASFRKLFARFDAQEITSMLQVQPFRIKNLLRPAKSGRTSYIRKNIFFHYLSFPRIFGLRIKSIFTDGLTNKYLTLVLKKKG